MSSSSGADSGGGGGGGGARVTIICAVCTDPLMKERSVQVATPCGHVFHKLCLINWYKDPKRNGSQEQYCCPICWKTTESDSDCKFRVFLDTEEDSDYLAILQTVKKLGQERDEIIERMSQEKTKALERLSAEQMEAVDRLRLEHSGKMEQLQQEYAEQIKRLQQEHTEQIKGLQRDQVDTLCQENTKTKTLRRTILQLRLENAQTLERHRQEQVKILREENAKTESLERTIEQLRQENAQNLEGLRKEQVATVNRLLLESEEKARLQQQEHAEQTKRLRQEQIATVNRLRVEHSNEKEQFLQIILSQNDEIQWQKDEIQNLKKPIDLLEKRVKALASKKLQREVNGLMEKFKRLDAAADGDNSGAKAPRFKDFVCSGATQVLPPGLHPSPKSTASVTKAIKIIPGSGQVQVQGSNGTDAAAASSKNQKIDDNTNKCSSITPTVQSDTKKQTKELIEKVDDGWFSSDDEDFEYLHSTLHGGPCNRCKKCRVVVAFEAREEHRQWHREQEAAAQRKQQPRSSGWRGGVNAPKR